jgi:hypothetical protein
MELNVLYEMSTLENYGVMEDGENCLYLYLTGCWVSRQRWSSKTKLHLAHWITAIYPTMPKQTQARCTGVGFWQP